MEIDFLKRIVKEATKISEKGFEVYTKGGEDDQVTSLDLEIETYLIGEIKKNYPGFDIISEEFNASSDVTDNCFIIDPIDGTKNFANHSPLWGIEIACRKNGRAVASVINLPRLNEFYWADETGAYLNDQKISIKEAPLKNALYAVDAGNSLPSIQRMRKYAPNFRSFGATCVAMAFAASGRLHGAVYRNDKPWDYEPGLFLCQMAGAKVKNVSGFHAVAMNQEFLDLLERETAKKTDASNIFILHSLNGDTLKTWGQDIKDTFERQEVDVIMPEFPIRSDSKYEKFDEILGFYLKNGQLNENSIVIAHSIGNACFVRFCKEHDYRPKAYIAVAPSVIYEYPSPRQDYIVDVRKNAYVGSDVLNYIRDMDSIKYCLYSDEDDNNKEKFTRFINDTHSEGMHLEGYNHFDGYHKIYKIPELNDLVSKLI